MRRDHTNRAAMNYTHLKKKISRLTGVWVNHVFAFSSSYQKHTVKIIFKEQQLLLTYRCQDVKYPIRDRDTWTEKVWTTYGE